MMRVSMKTYRHHEPLLVPLCHLQYRRQPHISQPGDDEEEETDLSLLGYLIDRLPFVFPDLPWRCPGSSLLSENI